MKNKNKILEKISDPFQRLFWKMQIDVLRTFPPLFGVVSKVSLGAQNSGKVWIKTLFKVAAQTPVALFLDLRNRQQKRVVLARISIPVTMRCTLNCDKCLSHIPDIKTHKDIPENEFAADINRLFSCVDYIYDLNLSGGEPFLHPNLDEILRVCSNPSKVDNVNLTTNGTLIPNAKILAALRETNTTVKISKYDKTLQPNVEKLKSVLAKNNINYTHESGNHWHDLGNYRKIEDRMERRRFSICVYQLCFVYVDGKLYRCAKSAILMKEGTIPDCKSDYINLRKTDRVRFRDELRNLLKKRSVSACSYCLGATYKTSTAPVAEQRIAR